MTFAPIAMSTLAIVLIVLAVVVAVFLVLGFLGTRARDRSQAGSWEKAVRAADAAFAQAAATDRGWHRESMEAAARIALEEHRPGWRYRDLHLVLVDDRPGIEEDRAQFMAIGDDGDEAAVVLSRQGDHWSAERVGQRAAVVPSVAAVPGFTAETDLERALIEDPVLQEGLAWGRPRRGHPEGSVGAHVADLLATIERWGETGKRREELRLLALVHDSLKNRVQNWRPKTGENHHAMRARRFAERYVDDERVLATIEQHDRPYALWRKMRRRGHLDEHAFTEMLDRIPDLDLFLRFVELDGSTEGKNREPIRWLKAELAQRGAFEEPGFENGSTER